MNHPVTIYHNPKCGTSRNTLAMIRAVGIEPTVIEYLKTPPTREELVALIQDMDISVRELLRAKENIYSELDLDNAKWSDDELIDQIMAHPILMNRPVVITELGTKLCRPSEVVLSILPKALSEQFTKEDGEVVKP